MNATAAALAAAKLPPEPTAPDGLPDERSGRSSVAAAVTAAQPADPWPEAQPLRRIVERIDYPLAALPPYVHDAVAEVQAYVQSPVAMLATSALSAMSLAAQGQIDVARDDTLSGPVSLFTLTIAESGERKTSGEGYFTKPIEQHEEEQRRKLAGPVRDYRAALASHKARCEGVLAQIRTLAKAGKPTEAKEKEHQELVANEPIRPRVPSILLTDATPEGLLHSLANEWPSAGIVSDEGGAVFGSHGMNKDTIMRNLSALNTLWGGGAQRVTRRTSESYVVKGARLSVAIQVQGPTLQEFLDKNGALARGSGFLARFLIADPESTQGTRLYRTAQGDWAALGRFHDRMARVLATELPITERGALEPATMQLSGEGKDEWIAFHDEIERQLGAGGDLVSVRDAASKAADNAVRIAALFAYFERALPSDPISAEHMRQAGQIAAWHLHEAQRFLGELSVSEDEQRIVGLNDWLVEHCTRKGITELTRREVQQLGPNPTRDGDRLAHALEGLVELGRVRLRREGQKVIVMVNPALLGEAAT